MNRAQQATAELHAAFFDISYTSTLVAMHIVNDKLPARRINGMLHEVQELKDMGFTRLPKGVK